MSSHRPFRSPHYTTGYVGLVGGGAWPRSGEITLAHCVALFHDEFPEFSQRVLEVLPQPLEDRVGTISRSSGALTYPANPVLRDQMKIGTLTRAGWVCVASIFWDAAAVCPPKR